MSEHCLLFPLDAPAPPVFEVFVEYKPSDKAAWMLWRHGVKKDGELIEEYYCEIEDMAQAWARAERKKYAEAGHEVY